MAHKQKPQSEQAVANHFKPGQSGNKSGRPKQLNWLVLRGREITPQLMGVLERIAFDGELEPSDRMRAIQMIWDRVYGRPKIAVEVDANIINSFVLKVPTLVEDAEAWEKKWGGKVIEHEDDEHKNELEQGLTGKS